MNSKVLGKVESQFFYGYRELILDYLGESEDYVIEGTFQHGDGPSSCLTNFLPTPRVRLKRIPLYVSSKLTADLFQSRGHNAIAIGSPILYACNKLGWDIRSEGIDSTGDFDNALVLPRHTRVYANETLSDHEIGERVRSFRRIVGERESTLLLYSLEFLSNSWRKWARCYGFDIACAGLGRTEPEYANMEQRVDFFVNLVSIINRFKTVYVEGISSAIHYSIFLNKRTKILTDHFAVKGLSQSASHILRWHKDQLPSLFGIQTQLTKREKRIVAMNLGAEVFPERHDLRRMLSLSKMETSHHSNK